MPLMDIRIIRNQDDHAWAVGEIDNFFTSGSTDPTERDRIAVLKGLVENYEIACDGPPFDSETSTWIDTIRARRRRRWASVIEGAIDDPVVSNWTTNWRETADF